jgi:prevent-host-death family protein
VAAITSTQANRSFSKLLAKAISGKPTDITVRGKAVARLIPITESDRKRAAELERYVRELSHRPVENHARLKREELYDE